MTKCGISVPIRAAVVRPPACALNALNDPPCISRPTASTAEQAASRCSTPGASRPPRNSSKLNCGLPMIDTWTAGGSSAVAGRPIWRALSSSRGAAAEAMADDCPKADRAPTVWKAPLNDTVTCSGRRNAPSLKPEGK